ncbi:MAG TPA: aminotransferase class III-fold pyridoxal phosphate-dependent enzyme, partial [Geobacteraceae bacterium]
GLKGRFPALITDVRGIGLMIGMEMAVPAGDIVKKGLERGVLLNVAQDKVMRFVPPLVVTKAEVNEMIGILAGILAEI